ncbi:hypothetical protein AVEN_46993-1 [Araneus ventricosus]|uniref:Secreted protein n=1 Tax=Araneus ventricosus TaxID=182803 RepID=A0A4Y2IMB5_ARAVE|nr:hypothetical protein AVEN_46993-1 [Araneus ventricosus]
MPSIFRMMTMMKLFQMYALSFVFRTVAFTHKPKHLLNATPAVKTEREDNWSSEVTCILQKRKKRANGESVLVGDVPHHFTKDSSCFKWYRLS